MVPTKAQQRAREKAAMAEAAAGVRALLTDASLDQPEHAGRRRAMDEMIECLEVPAPRERGARWLRPAGFAT